MARRNQFSDVERLTLRLKGSYFADTGWTMSTLVLIVYEPGETRFEGE